MVLRQIFRARWDGQQNMCKHGIKINRNQQRPQPATFGVRGAQLQTGKPYLALKLAQLNERIIDKDNLVTCSPSADHTNRPIMADEVVAAATGATAQPTAPQTATAAQMAAAAAMNVQQPQQHAMHFAPSAALMQQQAAQTRQAHMQQQQHNMAELNNKLAIFWNEQLEEVRTASDFKNHLLPLARIKKIMKSDEDVRMISAEAPVLFAKACEMFILELTHRAWAQTEEAKRRTLQRSDISTAIQKTDIFDFLIDIVPRDDPKKDDVRAVVGVDPQQQMQYYMQNPAGYAMPGQLPTAAAPSEQSGVMYQPNQQAAYANAGYTAGMFPQSMVNPPGYMRVPQQAAVMYAPPPQNYNQNYLTGNTSEQQQQQQPPPQS